MLSTNSIPGRISQNHIVALIFCVGRGSDFRCTMLSRCPECPVQDPETKDDLRPATQDCHMIAPVIAIAASIAAGVGLLILRTHHRRVRRRQLMAQGLPAEHVAVIERNVPLYRRLPEPLKAQLHGLVNVFLDEKQFEGCGGLEITDGVRLTIAAQACILLVNRPADLFPGLSTILVYPQAYMARETTFDGVVETEVRDSRLGESWERGPVVLAWDSVVGGSRNEGDGLNVVLHEFAHQLDQQDSASDGAPILGSPDDYPRWAEVFTAEYEALRKARRFRRRSVLDKYGATDPAEFFAVATETFFEKPRQLLKNHPDLYGVLKDYYKLDPAQWSG